MKSLFRMCLSRLLWSLFPIFFCPIFFWQPAGAQEETERNFSESVQHLATIPDEADLVSESVTARPEHGVLAYVYEEEPGFRVCLNEECSGHVDRVAQGMPMVSPNGEHWAAIVQKDGEVRVMLDGHLSDPYDMVHGLTFSPDSMELAYIAQEGEEFFVYVNQERQEPFAAIDPQQGLMYSNDSENLAYVASRDGENWHLVLNGEPGPEYESIQHVTFSPDSGSLAYAAEKEGRWHIVEDGQEGPGFLDIKRVSYCPQSESLAYIAEIGEGDVVVRDGEKSQVFEMVTGELVFSSDGERLAYSVAEVVGDEARMQVVVDGEPGPVFEQVGAYLFSPDGEEYAYMAVEEDKGLIVREGDTHPTYDSVGVPVFSRHTRELAYSVYEDETWRVKLEGEKGPGFDSVEHPFFSPSGESLAYLAKRGPLHQVVKDQEIVDSYQWAGLLQFSPEGEHLVYAAAKEPQESTLVVDGQKGEEKFFSFLRGSSLEFTSEDTVQGIALRGEGREYYLIRAQIEDRE